MPSFPSSASMIVATSAAYVLGALLLLGATPTRATCQGLTLAQAKAAPELLDQAGPRLADLQAAAQALTSADTELRASAIAQLSTLPVDALPALGQRLGQLRAVALDRPTAIPILQRLIDASETVQPDGAEHPPMPALHTGAAEVLMKTRDTSTQLVVETALLLASLERMKTTGAGLLMGDVMEIAGGAFRSELRRARQRAGEWLLPALIQLRSDGRVHVKRWAQAGVRALGAEDARMATNLDDPKRVAEVVTAYSEPLDFDAMPTLVRLTRSDRLQVREAARAAVGRFGKNAIWQLREFYEELTGRRAPRGWNAERTAAELYTVIDRPKIEAAQTAVTRGMQAYVAGDFEQMAQAFALALTKNPDHPQRQKMADGYAALGQASLSSGDLNRAETALRTAVHLAERDRDRAQLTFVRAQQAMAQGVVDRTAYEQVLGLDPTHAGAIAALDRISGRYEEKVRERKRSALIAGAALLLIAAGLVARYSLFKRTDTHAEPDAEAKAQA